jgi:ABC-type polysaccharide/polyol phosphate transport system ATPase subunit
MLKVISGLMPPDTGTVTVAGRISTLLELGAGFQGEYTGGENVYLYAALMGLSRKYVRARFDEIVEFSGIGPYIDNAVKTYSSGMYMRLAFAVAVHVDPELLVIDEVLAVGDEAFQRKCLERANELRERGTTICLVSHDLDAIQRFCDRAIWLDGGVIAADGNPSDVVKQYMMSLELGPSANHPDGSSLRVEDVTVTDGSGHARDAVRCGEPATVAFMAYSAAGFGQAHVNLRWIGRDGRTLFAAPTGDREILLPAGRSRMTCVFDFVPLVPGSYRIELSVTDIKSGAILNPPHEPILVSVVGPPTEGLVTAPYRWKLVDGASAVRRPADESGG